MRPVFPPLTPVFTRLTQSSQRWCEGTYIGSRTVEISFVTDLEAGPGSRQNEVTLGIDTIKDDELKGTPEFEQLRVACETTKTFTPTVSKKLIKPFVARMDEETLMERSQQSRNYGRKHLFDGIVTACAQNIWAERNPRPLQKANTEGAAAE